MENGVLGKGEWLMGKGNGVLSPLPNNHFPMHHFSTTISMRRFLLMLGLCTLAAVWLGPLPRLAQQAFARRQRRHPHVVAAGGHPAAAKARRQDAQAVAMERSRARTVATS